MAKYGKFQKEMMKVAKAAEKERVKTAKAQEKLIVAESKQELAQAKVQLKASKDLDTFKATKSSIKAATAERKREAKALSAKLKTKGKVKKLNDLEALVHNVLIPKWEADAKGPSDALY